MKKDKIDPGKTLDRIAKGIREEPVDAAWVDEAARRVRADLSGEGASDSGRTAGMLRGCEDFQALIPSYLDGALTEARRLLFEDHSRRCVPCRRALLAAREGAKAVAAVSAARSARRFTWPKLLAASVALAFALGSFWLVRNLSGPSGTLAQVETVDGMLYGLGERQIVLTAGGDVLEGQAIRTTRSGGALIRLADGSRVELAERTEIELEARHSGTTIRLERGNVIVEAADQRNGKLHVSTADCLVSVEGTVFAVNRGTKGSRVSVIEGKVEVNDGRDEWLLGAGDQVSTHPSLGRIPVEDEIAWSRQLDEHLALLREFAALGREIEEAVAAPEPRSFSRLLELVPQDTVVYAAMPNMSGSLSDAYRLFRSRIQSSQVLREWWAETGGREQAELKLDEAFQSLREVGTFLGEELVFSVQMDNEGRPSGHLVLAETGDGAGLRAVLQDIVARLEQDPDGRELLQLVDSPAALSQGGDGQAVLYVWLTDDLVAVSAGPELLREFESELNQGSQGLASRGFHDRIQEAYQDGLSWMLAADLQTIWERHAAGEHPDSLNRALDAYELTGFTDVEHLVLTQLDADSSSNRSALVTFNGPRRGLAAWLAAPAPMATLEFLSPDASFAAAFVVKDSQAMLDDLFQVFEQLEPGFQEDRRGFEAESGVLLRDELAALLGGEVAVAVDGPLLPMPSWRLIFEVYDPAGLQLALQQLVEYVDGEARRHGHEGLEVESQTVGGLEFYTLRRATGLNIPLHWTYVDGYMLVAPSRALLDRSIRYRESHINLAHSPEFAEQFPKDGHANFSALIYQNVAPGLAGMAERFAGTQGGLTPDQRAAIRELSANASASLFCGYAEQDRIRFSGQGTGGLFGGEMASMFQLGGLAVLEHAMDVHEAYPE